ncbi:hypothetical protein EIK77_004085 [Talaromyces pinophilus]|nr:hypothetical protein EIK77_004085 [Talaromyces pinophilus]
MSVPIYTRQTTTTIPQCFPTTTQQYGLDSTLYSPSEGRLNKSPDELLDIFRRDMAHQVPFISVPVQMSAPALSRERPFLYRAIMTVASYHDSVHQLQMGQELVRYIMEHLVVLGEKSLDLLQGLLVYINWYNSLFHANPQTNTLLGLAFSLLVDLNLYIPYKSSDSHEKFVGEMKTTVTSNPNWARKNTKFIVREFPSSNASVPNSSIGLHLKLLVSDLEKFKVTLPERLQQDGKLHPWWLLLCTALNGILTRSVIAMMLMHYHAVEILVSELCFYMTPTTPTQGPSPKRADALWMCLTATRTLINIYFSLNAQPHFSFSAIALQQLYLALATLSKLSLFKADDWDVNYAQPSIDLSTLLENLVTRTEELSSRYDVMENNKPWLQSSRRLRQVRLRFDDLLSNENVPSATLSAATTTTTQPSANGISVVAPSFHDFRLDQFGLWDDRFWQTMQDGSAPCTT